MITALSDNYVIGRAGYDREPVQAVTNEDGPDTGATGGTPGSIPRGDLLLGTRAAQYRQGFRISDGLSCGAEPGKSDQAEVTVMSIRTSIYARVSTRDGGQDARNQLH
jgi:hypothetical protein